MRVLGTPDDLATVAGQHDVDLVVLALAPVYAELADRLRLHCEALGLPAYAAATFVEMHFAGLPALTAGGAEQSIELADPSGGPRD